jgi:hypothetical protein
MRLVYEHHIGQLGIAAIAMAQAGLQEEVECKKSTRTMPDMFKYRKVGLLHQNSQAHFFWGPSALIFMGAHSKLRNWMPEQQRN